MKRYGDLTPEEQKKAREKALVRTVHHERHLQ